MPRLHQRNMLRGNKLLVAHNMLLVRTTILLTATSNMLKAKNLQENGPCHD